MAMFPAFRFFDSCAAVGETGLSQVIAAAFAADVPEASLLQKRAGRIAAKERQYSRRTKTVTPPSEESVSRRTLGCPAYSERRKSRRAVPL